MSFGKWLASTAFGTAAKTFVAVVVAAAIADFSSDGAISLGRWQTWVIMGLVSCGPVLVNAINPDDSRYGRVK